MHLLESLNESIGETNILTQTGQKHIVPSASKDSAYLSWNGNESKATLNTMRITQDDSEDDDEINAHFNKHE